MTLPDPCLRVLPSRDPHNSSFVLVRDFIERLGGPMGKYAIIGRQRWWTPLRVLLLVGLAFFSFGYLSKANCIYGKLGPDGLPFLDWAGNKPYNSACYSDIITLYEGRGFNIGGPPYAFSWVENDTTRYLEYPVLTGYFQAAMGWLTRTTYPLASALPGALAEAAWYFTLTALVFAALWMLVIRYTAELAGNRIWDVTLLAASPLVIPHALTNWDIPSILAAVLALVAYKRGGRWAPIWVGLWIGIGTALKLWPLYLLGALLVVAFRRRQLLRFMLTAFITGIFWLLVNIPVAVAYPAGWGEFARLNSIRGAEWTTIYEIIARLSGSQFSPGVLNSLSLIFFGCSCIGIAILGLTARRIPRLAELLFLIVAAFLFFNKVWSPQYSLWIVVPAILALGRWRPILAWMLVDIWVWPATLIFIGAESNRSIPHLLFDALLITRGALILVMVVIVIRQIRGRTEDVIAAAHSGMDPLVPQPAAPLSHAEPA
ncbi:glycosyltransferase family 87 protein [Corynebacterium caspium]|uniref:glycosyltransferase family 87 protein n=1 Tax=Corynebacterium caspium TaxID=234828 RepID=UPI0003632393|nr:glycosyltransferase 87 family protein [Corynebacterium caspium]WKD60028.1 hypothetical protein CCASP_08280 [Corynebacterium caspium DSM 44850]